MPRRNLVHWPWAIAAGLALVIVVNILFAVIAIRGADTVEPSYISEPR